MNVRGHYFEHLYILATKSLVYNHFIKYKVLNLVKYIRLVIIVYTFFQDTVYSVPAFRTILLREGHVTD